MKILAIDDDRGMLKLLRTLLERRVPDVCMVSAETGAEGLDRARTEAPDVILLDIVLPGMDGYAVCRALKADPDLRDIPVLMLTGKVDTPDGRIRAIEAGAEGFLAKPFDENEWLANIRAFEKLRNTRRETRRTLEDAAEKEAARSRELERELQERIRAETEQLESQRKIQSIFRVFPVGIGLVRDRRLLDVNRYICDLTGYAAEELIGQNTRFLYPDQETYDAVVRRPERALQATETRWKRKDGTLFDVLLHSTPLDPSAPELGRTFMVMDISSSKREREQQAEQLAELRRWYTVTLGREKRILELKKEVNELRVRLGETPPYEMT